MFPFCQKSKEKTAEFFFKFFLRDIVPFEKNSFFFYHHDLLLAILKNIPSSSGFKITRENIFVNKKGGTLCVPPFLFLFFYAISHIPPTHANSFFRSVISVFSY